RHLALCDGEDQVGHRAAGAGGVGARIPTFPVIAREGGRSSIPETFVFNREAAAYWVPRLRGGRRPSVRQTPSPLKSSDCTRQLPDACAAPNPSPRTCRASALRSPGSRPPRRVP